MKIHPAPQGSASWLDARKGMLTGSRIKDVMATLKNGGETAGRNGYKWELVSERLSGFTADHYVSPDMERGTNLEPIARSEYEIETGNMVDQVGLVFHPTIERFACSADGLISTDGAIELKAPRTHRQLQWILAGTVPPEHQWQCVAVMDCCERDWIDFGSFDPSLPEGLRLFVVRMYRDDMRIALMREEVIKFDAEVEEIVHSLRSKVKAAAPGAPMPEDMSGWAAAFDDFIQGDVTP